MENKKEYTYDEVYKATLEYFKGDDLAASTWIKKYCLTDEEGHYLELTPDDMHRRLAREFARIEDSYEYKMNHDDKLKLSEYGYNRKPLDEEAIYQLFSHFRYVSPAGSVMSGLGSNQPVSLSNCFVVDGPLDSIDGIFKVAAEQAQLSKRRGGVGFDLNRLRPNGATVNNSANTSSGAASFMDLFSQVTNTIGQKGRRGAALLAINISHPDAEEFIVKKQDLTKVTGANVSVQITDKFMNLLTSNDDTFVQRFPVTEDDSSLADSFEGLEYGKLYEGKKKGTWFKLVHAKELWKTLIHCAWNTAEPGILFEDRHFNYSPDGVYESFRGTCTNPCVIGSTSLLTRNGYIQIQDVVGKDIEIWNGKEWTDVKPFKTSDSANVYEVTFSNGKKLVCTEYHKFILSGNVRKELKDCKAGDRLETYSNPIEGAKESPIIVSITYSGKAATYCVTDPKNHSALFNGIMTGNCGEIFMREDSCRLIHINLASFVDNPFTDEASFNFEKLYKVTYETFHLGDDLVDLEKEALERIMKKVENDGDKDGREYKLYERLLKHTLEGRRCGVGFLGLSDAIAMIGMKLDSDEGLEMIDRILHCKYQAELTSEVDLAVERGAFPSYDKELEMKGNEWYDYVKTEFPEIAEKMYRYGRRNVSESTVAPTGTLSLLAQVSSGIEPLFMPYYVRRRKCMNDSERVDFVDVVGEKYTEFVVVHPTLKEWAKAKYPGENVDEWTIDQWKEAYEKSPWFGSTAPDIDWKKRVEIQGIAQTYTSHSISSCVVKDTLIETNGGLYYADELADFSMIQPGEFKTNDEFVYKVLTHTGEYRSITSFYNNGTKDTYELTLEDGRYLVCTSNEKFLVFNENEDNFEWKQMKELQIGDRVRI